MEAELLLLAIIQAQDAESATRALTQAGLRVTRIGSVGGFLRTANVTLLLGLNRDELDALMAAEYRATRISTSGGFFRKGNATLLVGVEASQVDAVLKRIKDACASVAEQTRLPASGATVFVLNAEQYERV